MLVVQLVFLLLWFLDGGKVDVGEESEAVVDDAVSVQMEGLETQIYT